jgi:hypothetical protein
VNLKQKKKDEQTYEAVFNSQPNECAECGCLLPDDFRDDNGNVIFRTQYAHIYSKGAFPEHRNDPRNFVRLCWEHHRRYDDGFKVEQMNIYGHTESVKNMLRDEYNNKKGHYKNGKYE